MRRIVPNMLDYLEHCKQLRSAGDITLESISSKEIPDGKIYVEDGNISTAWHRHVEEHGPKPEAYALYNHAVTVFEEKLCKI